MEDCRPTRSHAEPIKHSPRRYRKHLRGGHCESMHRASPQEWIYSRLWQKASTRGGEQGFRSCLAPRVSQPISILSAHFASTMDCQHTYANAPEPIIDYNRKRRDVIRHVLYKFKRKLCGTWMKEVRAWHCQPCNVIAALALTSSYS